MSAAPAPPLEETKTAEIVRTTAIDNAKTQGDVQNQILSELRQLNRFQVGLADNPVDKSQLLLASLLESAGILMAILFGVFSALAWKAAMDANSLSGSANDAAGIANSLSRDAVSLSRTATLYAQHANQLALVSYCQTIVSPEGGGGGVSSTNGISTNATLARLCAQIASRASNNLASLASVYYDITVTGATPSALPSATDSTPSTGVKPSQVSIITISIIGSISGLVLLSVVAAVQRRRYKNKVRKNQAVRRVLKDAHVYAHLHDETGVLVVKDADDRRGRLGGDGGRAQY